MIFENFSPLKYWRIRHINDVITVHAYLMTAQHTNTEAAKHLSHA